MLWEDHAAVNTLASFYDKNKCVALLDTTIMKACNSTTLALLLSRIIQSIDKDWIDVLGRLSSLHEKACF